MGSARPRTAHSATASSTGVRSDFVWQYCNPAYLQRGGVLWGGTAGAARGGWRRGAVVVRRSGGHAQEVDESVHAPERLVEGEVTSLPRRYREELGELLHAEVNEDVAQLLEC